MVIFNIRIFPFFHHNFFLFIKKDLKSVSSIDYQEIYVQEKLDGCSTSIVPKSILVILDNDLVDSCKPGDDVTIK